jgi:hypothetical protein
MAQVGEPPRALPFKQNSPWSKLILQDATAYYCTRGPLCKEHPQQTYLHKAPVLDVPCAPTRLRLAWRPLTGHRRGTLTPTLRADEHPEAKADTKTALGSQTMVPNLLPAVADQPPRWRFRSSEPTRRRGGRGGGKATGSHHCPCYGGG